MLQNKKQPVPGVPAKLQVLVRNNKLIRMLIRMIYFFYSKHAIHLEHLEHLYNKLILNNLCVPARRILPGTTWNSLEHPNPMKTNSTSASRLNFREFLRVKTPAGAQNGLQGEYGPLAGMAGKWWKVQVVEQSVLPLPKLKANDGSGGESLVDQHSVGAPLELKADDGKVEVREHSAPAPLELKWNVGMYDMALQRMQGMGDKVDKMSTLSRDDGDGEAS